ncbi:hypothetical protein BH24CHL7_BH24CHL7_00850 [soil metagenome]
MPGHTIGAMTQPATGSGAAAGRRTIAPVLALDLGGTQLRAAVVLADGSLRGRSVARTPRTTDGDAIVRECLELLRRAAASATADESPQALGISAPGPLDARRGVFLDPPNLPRSLWNFPLAAALSSGVGLPAALDKDTNVAALAEGRFGAAQGIDDYVYLTVSTGVGGAVVNGGRLVTGADGAGGELGHLMVDPNGPACGCGVRGHLEAYSSGTGIAAALRRAVADGLVRPGTPLAVRAAEQGADMLEARDVARAEDDGDLLAAEIMTAARYALASAMVTIVNVFNPTRVIVGGGISLGQGDRLLEPARAKVREEAFRVQAASVDIVSAGLGDDVGLVGALALVADRLSPRPSTVGRSALMPGAPEGEDSNRTPNQLPDLVTRSAEEVTT